MAMDEFEGHTPGPWRAEHVFVADFKTGERHEEWAIVTDDHPLLLASYAETPLTEANARLIAAAPSLLSENKRLREGISAKLAEHDAQRMLPGHTFNGDSPFCEWNEIRVLLARSALAPEEPE